MPHCASALYIEPLHSLGQIDLPLIVLLLKPILHLLKYLPHRRFNILLCHEAGAKLFGNHQWKRLCYWLSRCLLRLDLRRSTLFRSARSCLSCCSSALRCADSSISFCCVTLDHIFLCLLRYSRSIRSPCGSAALQVSWTFCHPDCTANVQSRCISIYGERWNSITSNPIQFKSVQVLSS